MAQCDQLVGKTFLVVEDEFFTATMLTMSLEDAGARVIGPVSNVDSAIDLVSDEIGPVHAALLDINLNGTTSFDLAEKLADSGTSIIFTTGYDRHILPQRFAGCLCFEKPYDHEAIIDALAAL